MAMQTFKDYYQILGVAPSASNDEIKKSFRRLARKYHPDVNPGDNSAEEKFKDIGEAYDILSDATKRQQYDRFAKLWKQKRTGRTTTKTRSRTPSRNGAGNDVFDQYPSFESFLDNVLHRNGAPRPGTRVETDNPFRPTTSKKTYTVPSQAPRDVEARLTLPLDKAYRGGRERIRLEDGRSLEVKMPMGMVSGQRIRLRGQGTNGGDLYLKITVAPHSVFRLEGPDVVCTVPVTPSEAVLGGAIPVPTLDGTVKMSLPAGVRSGARLRLSGKGYPTGVEKRGDQLVEIQIVAPKEISDRERELYEKLRQIETFDPRREL